MAEKRDPSPKRCALNFWAVGGFKETVKRIEQSKHLTELLEDMINERAIIETKHAEKLKSWSNFFYQQIVTSGEYGNMLDIWKESLKEGQMTYKYHDRAANLLTQLLKTVHKWRKAKYKKATGFGSEYHIVQEMRERFTNAQSSHKTNMDKIKHYWKCYQDSIEVYETCVRRLRKHPGPENELKVNASRLNGQTAKSHLLFAYQRLNEGKQDYLNRMEIQFVMTEREELERMEFFKSQLEQFVKITDILETGSYQHHLDAIESMFDCQTDLRDWRDMYGPGQDISAAWPDLTNLHPFTEDFVTDTPSKPAPLQMLAPQPESSKSKTRHVVKDQVINIFHKIGHKDKSPNRRVVSPPPPNAPTYTFVNRVAQTVSQDVRPVVRPKTPTPESSEQTRVQPLKSAWNDGEEERDRNETTVRHSAWDDNDDCDEEFERSKHEDQPQPVISVQEYFAIADYDSKAHDELSFKQGDVLVLEYTFSPFYNYYHMKDDESMNGYAPTSHLERLQPHNP